MPATAAGPLGGAQAGANSVHSPPSWILPGFSPPGFSPGATNSHSSVFEYVTLIRESGGGYSQSRFLKITYRLVQTTAISRIANGYPAAQCSSGMVSKFIP